MRPLNLLCPKQHCLAFSSRCPLSSNQHNWLTTAMSIICILKKFLELWKLNPELLCKKQVCYLCALQPPPLNLIVCISSVQFHSQNPSPKISDRRLQVDYGVPSYCWFLIKHAYLMYFMGDVTSPTMRQGVIWCHSHSGPCLRFLNRKQPLQIRSCRQIKQGPPWTFEPWVAEQKRLH